MSDAASFPVQLARRSISYYLTHGKLLPLTDQERQVLPEQAAAFVSLKKGGHLRGCIGTVTPVQECLAAEIVCNAVSAATQDPRFPPVDASELPELEVSVDVLTPPEPVETLAELDPKRYGIIVRQGRRSGLLLPLLEGVNTVTEQIAIAQQKAGIPSGVPIEVYRFTVVRYT